MAPLKFLFLVVLGVSLALAVDLETETKVNPRTEITVDPETETWVDNKIDTETETKVDPQETEAKVEKEVDPADTEAKVGPKEPEVEEPEVEEPEVEEPEVEKADLKTSDLEAPDMGNWTVPHCIVVKMAGKLTVVPLVDNSTYSVEVDLPTDAEASGDCTNPNNQTISLKWTEKETGTKWFLKRTLKIVFARNDTASPPVYGVKNMEGTYETRHFKKKDNTTYFEFITFGTFSLHPMEFQTPINRSYLCMDVGTISMHAELHESDEPQSAVGEKLNNVNFTAKNVQFDAFRPMDISENMLQTPLDCSFRPSDVVPIVVGCALAGTVLLVLISYLVGRRRNRARGYQSV